MAIGSSNNDGGDKPLDRQGGSQSAGVPAGGELEGNSYHPLGNPGLRHWQASYITQPGLDDRSSVFFAAVEMTRGASPPASATKDSQECAISW